MALYNRGRRPQLPPPCTPRAGAAVSGSHGRPHLQQEEQRHLLQCAEESTTYDFKGSMEAGEKGEPGHATLPRSSSETGGAFEPAAANLGACSQPCLQLLSTRSVNSCFTSRGGSSQAAHVYNLGIGLRQGYNRNGTHSENERERYVESAVAVMRLPALRCRATLAAIAPAVAA